MEHRIAPQDVKVGMFVCGFGGSWFDHPFWFARFEVTPGHLAQLRDAAVPYVVIDDRRGVGPAKPTGANALAALSESESSSPLAASFTPGHAHVGPASETDPEPGRGSSRAGRRERARQLLSRSYNVVRDAFAAIRSGRPPELEEVNQVVADIVATAGDCPRTLLEIIRLKQKDEYTYLHSVAVCTLMANVARHLGRSEEEIFEYGLAGLLHDVGKVRVDDSILNKPGKLSDEEFALVRRHPEHGHDILSETPGLSPAVLDVCRHHHERPDGRGYPSGLQGEALTEAARLGAICDVYDALTSDRAYKSSWTPMAAITAMWSWEGQFDRALLFAFMQSIGVFAKDLVVELRHNRLAIIIDPLPDSERMRALVFYSTADRRPLVPEEIEISDMRGRNAVLGIPDPAFWGGAEVVCAEENIRSESWHRHALKAAVG